MKKFQTTLGYALRILYYLGKNGERLATGTEISLALGISYEYLSKVLAKLRENSMIQSEQGRDGGYRIVKGIEQISVYEVIKAIEGTLELYESPKSACKYDGEDEIVRYFNDVKKQMEVYLKEMSVKDLFSQKTYLQERADAAKSC
ncbi:MAG: Rrf2 family transcriptional regulator [Christensenella sp.]|uniref:RrF2 family transcriptional regulator n=1 Tax=Christensenella sp. TaxID=1935934 RepID=UPI002B212031|nr:Rrf2 family transcriptional regulator [Christensenella sp.]MEA5003695.1 Rrf2 family transcriptional regulator [Christensenella sp.]